MGRPLPSGAGVKDRTWRGGVCWNEPSDADQDGGKEDDAGVVNRPASSSRKSRQF